MYSAVAALFNRVNTDCSGHDCWPVLRQDLLDGFSGAGKHVVVVIGDTSWIEPSNAPYPDAAFVADVQQRIIDPLQQPPVGCTVLAYVPTRDASGNVDEATALARVGKWLDPAHGWPGLDGIYFDEAVLPQDVASAQQLAIDYHTTYRVPYGKKMMLLAGQCPDQWVVVGPPQHPEAAPDWALLWEDTIGAYRDAYYPALPNGNGTTIPRWWKDPAHRSKIAHTVHHCTTDQEWQDAVGLANERNVGLIYPLDVPGGPSHDRYDHVAPWFGTAAGWANSFNNRSIGLADHELLRAAHLWAARQGKVHGWPNFEQRWAGSVEVRGTYVLNNPAGVTRQILTSRDFGLRPPPTYDVSGLWQAVHEWATRQPGLLTAMPTFELMPAGEVAVVTFDAAAVGSWARVGTVAGPSTYQHPTFAEAGSVVRNVHRAAQATTPPHTTAFPTFSHDAADPTGRLLNGIDQYECVFIDFPAKNPASVGEWSDLDATTYLRALTLRG